MSFYYQTSKVRKKCLTCDKWKTTREHFKKTCPDKDGFNKMCTTCEAKGDKKVCNKCEKKLPFDEFHKNKSNKDGRHYSCKKCTKGMAEDVKRKKKKLRAKSS